MRAGMLMGLVIAATPCIAGGQSVPATSAPVLQPRQPTTVIVPPNRTQPAAPSVDTPLQQPSPSRSLPAHGAAAAAADIKTEEIRCKGGPTILFEDKGSRLGPAGAGLTDLIFAIPHPNARGEYPAAGADGAWLEEGTCAFAERGFVLGTDPQAIRYESSGPAGGNPEGKLERPDQYWRFNVYKTSYGHFVATSHGEWKPVVTRRTAKEFQSLAEGGPGGYPFDLRCDAGFYLAGMDVRVGHDIDAIRPICARIFPDGTRAEIDPRENWVGGQGGSSRLLLCPQFYPFVRSIGVEWEGIHSVILNRVSVDCGAIVPPGKHGATLGLPIAADGPRQHGNAFDDEKTFGVGGGPCPEGMTPAGVHGRSGTRVHALGLHCREIVELRPKALVADLHVAGLPAGTREPAPPVNTPPPNTSPGTPTPPHDQDDPVVGITGVKINAGVRAVDFRFDARPNASPHIELSTKKRPVSSIRLTTARDPAKGSATVARYAGSSRAQGLVLAQDTTYHYVIVVPGEGMAKEQRASGKFKTRSQQMRSPESTRK